MIISRIWYIDTRFVSVERPSQGRKDEQQQSAPVTYIYEGLNGTTQDPCQERPIVYEELSASIPADSPEIYDVINDTHV